MRSELREFTVGDKRRLRVCANLICLGEILPAVLRAYLLSHPDVHVDLRERLSFQIVQALLGGQTDIGILSSPVQTEALQVLPYRHDKLVLVVPANHPLASVSSMSFAEALEYEHVGLSEDNNLTKFLAQFCVALRRPMVARIRVNSFETISQLVEAGVGVGVLPYSVAIRHSRTMSLAIVALTDAWATRPMQICVRSMSALPRFARDFVELLVEDVRSDGHCSRDIASI